MHTSETFAEVKDYGPDIERYMDGVLSGEITASRPVRLAVKRQRWDLKSAGERGYYFDPETANKSIAFIEDVCVHTKTSISAKAGDPLKLSDSQKFCMWCLFGWKRTKDDRRRFKRGHIEAARKWGKSTFLSAIALRQLVADGEASPEVYCAATKEDQAKIVFREASATASESPLLKDILKVERPIIKYPDKNGFLKTIGSDSKTTDGLNPSCVVLDELHAWQKKHRGLHEKLMTAGGARLQPLWLVITTAGDDDSRLWQEEREYALRCVESVLTGKVIDDTLFAFIACIDYEEYTCIECMGKGCEWCEDGRVLPDDPFDEDVWIKAQPNLGVSVDYDWFREGANEAKNKPTAMNSYLQYRCNVQVSSSARAIDPVLWANCSAKSQPDDGDYCCGGFDLGRADDFAAWTLVFPDDAEDTGYSVISRSYTCTESSGLEGEIKQLANDGLLTVFPGDQVDFAAIQADIVEVSNRYQVRSWAFDPTFAMQMSQELLNVHGIECFKFTQAYRHYNESIRELLRLLKRQLIRHGGDPVLAWQANNLIIKKDYQDLWMPDKINSSGKIDAMVSLLMGLSECLFHADEGGRGEFYEANEVEFA